MTKAWQVPADMWQGATVAILGNSPAMTRELADSLAGFKRIAVNSALQHAPGADVFIGLDPDSASWAAAADFAGLRICGVERDDVDALYCGMHFETVVLGPHHTARLRNNFLAAMRIAALAGAWKIVLAGVDAPLYDQLHDETGFAGFTAGLAQVTAELQAQGIKVEVFDHAVSESMVATKPVGARKKSSRHG